MCSLNFILQVSFLIFWGGGGAQSYGLPYIFQERARNPLALNLRHPYFTSPSLKDVPVHCSGQPWLDYSSGCNLLSVKSDVSNLGLPCFILKAKIDKRQQT
jgi:hypothetical protein